MRRGQLSSIENAERIRMIRTRWRESGIGGCQSGWVEMVSLEGNRWKGLYTEWVILIEGG